jgi:amino acid permease
LAKGSERKMSSNYEVKDEIKQSVPTEVKKDSASGNSTDDAEKNIQVGSGPELQRRLKSRHLQMIAIGSLAVLLTS